MNATNQQEQENWIADNAKLAPYRQAPERGFIPGSINRGDVTGWAKGVSKPFGTPTKPKRPECAGPVLSISRPIKSLKDLKPFNPQPQVVTCEIKRTEQGIQVIRHDGTKGSEVEINLSTFETEYSPDAVNARRVNALLNYRSVLTDMTKRKVRKRAGPSKEPATEIKYQSKPIGRKGTKTRLFTKCQGYSALPPLPASGGLSEAELAKLRDRSIPRD